MDIGRVLARSLELAWRLKFLWLFGFIMALTSGGSRNTLNYSLNRTDFTRPPFGTATRLEPGILLLLLGLGACLSIVFLVLALYFRFVARGALVTSVRDIESGSTPTLRTAWGEGRRYYGRLLGLGFLVNVPLIIVTALVILAAVLPLIASIIGIASSSSGGSTSAGPIVAAVFAFIFLICCAVLCILLINLLIHPVYEFAVRAIVLENQGVMQGLARGYRLLTSNLGAGALLYLGLIGARIVWGMAVAILALPLGLGLFAVVAAAFSSNQFAGILLASALGIPFILLFSFLEGLFQVFESNAWTEGYMSILNPPPPIIAPVTAPPTAPSAPAAAA